MNQTVVGVFDTRAQAHAASEALEAQGFSRSAIQITDEAGPATTVDASGEEPGFFESIGNFFGRMFGDDEERRERHARPYAEAVRRGHCVLRVDVEDHASSERAVRVLEGAGAVDVDERMSQWLGQSADSAGGDEARVAGDSVAGNLYTPTEAAPGPSAVYPPVMGDTPEVVQAGEARRTEQPRGGPVRVYPRDGARRDGDTAATAGVATTTTAATVRRDDDAAPLSTTGEEAAWRTAADSSRHHDADDRDDDSTFRRDYESRFGESGGSYDDYAAAYHYGRRLRGDERHVGRSWEEMEADARSGWEQEHREGESRKDWDEVRDAVHYSWRDTTGPA